MCCTSTCWFITVLAAKSGADNQAELVDESIQHAKEAIALDVKDGNSWCKTLNLNYLLSSTRCCYYYSYYNIFKMYLAMKMNFNNLMNLNPFKIYIYFLNCLMQFSCFFSWNVLMIEIESRKPVILFWLPQETDYLNTFNACPCTLFVTEHNSSLNFHFPLILC